MTSDLLQVRGLTKDYATTDPPTQVLAGIDLTVRRGEFVAVMGASGSGKSTLLYCATGMDRPTSGSVLLDGQDLGALDDVGRSRVRLTQLGFVFQQGHFLRTMTIRDNVLLPALKASPDRRREAVERVDGLLARFGLAEVADHAPSEVSGGQLQRASICRALGTRPAMIAADEPTGALNRSMSAEVMDALSEVHAEGTTVVMVTHDPVCAARADRVVYLRDGLVEDSRDLGPWRADEAAGRTDTLLGWLRGLGF